MAGTISTQLDVVLNDFERNVPHVQATAVVSTDGLVIASRLPSEVEEVLGGECRVFRKETGKVEGEHLYNALGRTEAARLLSVFFIRKLGSKALIITARDMNKSERKRYEKK